MSEEWKSIPGYEGLYEVSNDGQVRQITHKLLKHEHCKNGYLRVALRKDKREKHWLVHRLVAMAFIGTAPVGLNVNHRDGTKTNNSRDNLEYVTQSDNVLHAFRVLKRPPHHFGESTHFAKLTDNDVIHIRHMRSEGHTYKAIAEKFNTKPANVWHICSGHTWKHLLPWAYEH